MTKPMDLIFDFIGLHGCASHCRVRLFQPSSPAGAAPVVMLSELGDNDGTSVTNAAESIAAQVCDFYDLDGADVIWIEHYPDERPERERAAGRPDSVWEEHFSAVNFERIERPGEPRGALRGGRRREGWNFVGARWAPLSVAQVETLIGAQWVGESA